MTVDEAEAYHSKHMAILADAGVAHVTIKTLIYVEEAIGAVRAAKKIGIPIVVSFTTETDGTLPSGQKLGDAIQEVDKETDGYPVCFMINCAHPTHIMGAFKEGEGQPWLARLHYLNCNGSKKSHAELNDCDELDIGDPEEFGRLNVELKRINPAIHIFGGCCGTDKRHIEATFKALREAKMLQHDQ